MQLTALHNLRWARSFEQCEFKAGKWLLARHDAACMKGLQMIRFFWTSCMDLYSIIGRHIWSMYCRCSSYELARPQDEQKGVKIERGKFSVVVFPVIAYCWSCGSELVDEAQGIWLQAALISAFEMMEELVIETLLHESKKEGVGLRSFMVTYGISVSNGSSRAVEPRLIIEVQTSILIWLDQGVLIVVFLISGIDPHSFSEKTNSWSEIVEITRIGVRQNVEIFYWSAYYGFDSCCFCNNWYNNRKYNLNIVFLKRIKAELSFCDMFSGAFLYESGKEGHVCSFCLLRGAYSISGEGDSIVVAFSVLLLPIFTTILAGGSAVGATEERACECWRQRRLVYFLAMCA